ncbi:N-acetyltransferase [Rhabdaerophilum sp. SD176]|uniref:GNAT family N-acetyltransferase n=1 Tax=Rhabdaerophilum sp. SD176 TaxID=2983548 RepID=UPI0024DF3B1C|nr:N-acetyltransferase [Rhabdaerophilum sp. SD176]
MASVRPVTIRRLGKADAPAFRAVRLRGLTDHPDAFTSTAKDWDLPLEAYIERIEAGHVIGAFDPETGALLGHVFLPTHLATGVKTCHKCEVWSVYVVPEGRGRGISEAMLSHAIELARSLGFSWLKLQVGEHNAPARQTYERLGFEVYGREEDYLRLPDGRSITELMMQLRL